ncbi:MAG: hypothetical protein JSR29_18625 [Nitrospira sp.]|nr:hypothetical protein [Nitrospira sp.]
MKRVAVFGNAGGGKSTLEKVLANITGLPLHPIDSFKYRQAARRSTTPNICRSMTDF